MKALARFVALVVAMGVLSGCGGPSSFDTQTEIVVRSLEDALDETPEGMTLRSALALLPSGGRIIFDPALDGGTIDLTVVGEEHTTLKGEVFHFIMGEGFVFQGYQVRDYGRSALYAAKNVTIDASALPSGITLNWTGGEGDPARVLAVYGNLTLDNVNVTGGRLTAQQLVETIPIPPILATEQLFTLSRGAGLAVWGTTTLRNCTLSDNRAEGDVVGGRDRGAFGGGVYANNLVVEDCVISGNSVKGYGAGGGGVYSVGGGSSTGGYGPRLSRCVLTGNRVTGQHAYGGGVYSDGGGPGNRKPLELTNCTIARNLVEDNPDIDQDAMSQYYYRGGGAYMSNGYLYVKGCTIVENEVHGEPFPFNEKPNMAGGGVAATIGNAHVVEDMVVGRSIVAGNRVNEYDDTGAFVRAYDSDVYTGSLIGFYSQGYNRIGVIDFSQILVPVPPARQGWQDMNRKHWPMVDDQDGTALADVVNLAGVVQNANIPSLGADAGGDAVLWYPPAGSALDAVAASYTVEAVIGGYDVDRGAQVDDFLSRILEELKTNHGYTPSPAFLATNYCLEILDPGSGEVTGQDCTETYNDEPIDIVWHYASVTWPSDPANANWIKFWRDLDADLDASFGAVKLGEAFWGTFEDGHQLGDNITMRMSTETFSVELEPDDQRGQPRPAGAGGDVGAVEL